MIQIPPPPFSGYFSKKQVEGDSAAKIWASDVVKLHVLPPVPGSGAMWTTPFMRQGARMYNSVDGGYLAADMSADGGSMHSMGTAEFNP